MWHRRSLPSVISHGAPRLRSIRERRSKWSFSSRSARSVSSVPLPTSSVRTARTHIVAHARAGSSSSYAHPRDVAPATGGDLTSQLARDDRHEHFVRAHVAVEAYTTNWLTGLFVLFDGPTPKGSEASAEVLARRFRGETRGPS